MSDIIKQAVQQQFGRTAAAYVSSPTHADGTDLQRMVELATLRGSERVLDIATGGGHTALAFAPHVREVVATDLTPAMLIVAEQFIRAQGITNVRFEHADAEALPFADRTFDVVSCRIAPHHFPDVAQFVREAARVLRSGGVFVLIDTLAPEQPELDQFINEIEKLRDPSHGRNYTISEWRGLCEGAGLRIDHTETFTKTMKLPDWHDRAQTPPDVRAEINQLLRNATPDARHTFAITGEADHVTQFVLYGGLLVARKD